MIRLFIKREIIMKEIDVTKAIALRFWWSYIWRFVLFYLSAWVLSLIATSFEYFTEIKEINSSLILQIYYWTAWIVINLFVLKHILKQKYNKFRISVVDKKNNEEVESISYAMTIHFFWSFFWKTSLIMLGFLIPSGIIFCTLGYIIITSSTITSKRLSEIIVLLISAFIIINIVHLIIQICVLKNLLKAEYKDYRVTVLE